MLQAQASGSLQPCVECRRRPYSTCRSTRVKAALLAFEGSAIERVSPEADGETPGAGTAEDALLAALTDCIRELAGAADRAVRFLQLLGQRGRPTLTPFLSRAIGISARSLPAAYEKLVEQQQQLARRARWQRPPASMFAPVRDDSQQAGLSAAVVQLLQLLESHKMEAEAAALLESIAALCIPGAEAELSAVLRASHGVANSGGSPPAAAGRAIVNAVKRVAASSITDALHSVSLLLTDSGGDDMGRDTASAGACAAASSGDANITAARSLAVELLTALVASWQPTPGSYEQADGTLNKPATKLLVLLAKYGLCAAVRRLASMLGAGDMVELIDGGAREGALASLASQFGWAASVSAFARRLAVLCSGAKMPVRVAVSAARHLAFVADLTVTTEHAATCQLVADDIAAIMDACREAIQLAPPAQAPTRASQGELEERPVGRLLSTIPALRAMSSGAASVSSDDAVAAASSPLPIWVEDLVELVNAQAGFESRSALETAPRRWVAYMHPWLRDWCQAMATAPPPAVCVRLLGRAGEKLAAVEPKTTTTAAASDTVTLAAQLCIAHVARRWLSAAEEDLAAQPPPTRPPASYARPDLAARLSCTKTKGADACVTCPSIKAFLASDIDATRTFRATNKVGAKHVEVMLRQLSAYEASVSGDATAGFTVTKRAANASEMSAAERALGARNATLQGYRAAKVRAEALVASLEAAGVGNERSSGESSGASSSTSRVAAGDGAALAGVGIAPGVAATAAVPGASVAKWSPPPLAAASSNSSSTQ